MNTQKIFIQNAFGITTKINPKVTLSDKKRAFKSVKERCGYLEDRVFHKMMNLYVDWLISIFKPKNMGYYEYQIEIWLGKLLYHPVIWTIATVTVFAPFLLLLPTLPYFYLRARVDTKFIKRVCRFCTKNEDYDL